MTRPMNTNDLAYFLLGIIFLLSLTVVVLVFVPPAHTSSAARLERHCLFMRMTLEQELGHLFASDPQSRTLARLSFEQLESEDWREVALCAPEGAQVVQGCVTGDTPCMAAAVTRALAAIGER